MEKNKKEARNARTLNRKKIKRVLAVVLSILMVVTVMDYSCFQNIKVALASSQPATYTYDISEGAITITAGTNSNTLKVAYGAGLFTDNVPISQAITIIGTTNGTRNRVYIVGVTATIVLSNVSITTEYGWTWASPIELSSGANVTLKLSGSNTLFSSDCGAGISVPAGCSITITSNNGDGSTDGILNSTAHGDALNASAGYFYDGAGIGAEGGTGVTAEATKTVGTIMIKGGTINATGGAGGAGIGGSIKGTTGSITITGGKVTATAGIYNNNGVAGIGGGFAGYVPEISITGGEVQAVGRSGGAGIGGGYGSNSCGNISIMGGKVAAKSGGYDAASIGYGSDSAKTGGSVTITGGDINLNGGSVNPEATNGIAALKQYNLNLTINDERLTTSLQNALVMINDMTYTRYINVTNSVGTTSVTAFIPATITGEKSLTINAAPYSWTTTVNINGTGGDIFVTISPKAVSSPTIELSANNFTYDGTAKEPTVTVKDGNTVIDSSEYTVGYSDNTNVGTATVTVSDVAGGNYTVNGTQTFAITGATPTVTVSASPLSSASYGSSVTLITNISGVNSEIPTGTVTFKDGTNTIASDIALTDGTASYTWTTTAIGDHSIIVEYTPSSDGIGKNYISATSSFLSYTITKQNQSELNIDNIGTKNYGDDSFTLSTTGGNGTGAVIYTSSDPTIVSISGTTATIHNAGNVTITATKAEDSTYIETNASVSLTIGKATPTVTLDADTTGKVFGDTVSITASVSGVNSELPTGTLTLKEGNISIATASLYNGVGILTWTNLPIGDHTISVEYTAASDDIGKNYTNAQSNTITFNVAKADITGVTVTGNTGVYQGFMTFLPGYTISGTIPEGVKVYYQWKLEDGSWSNGGTYWNPAWESGIGLNHTGSITVRVKLSGDNYNDYISDEVTSTLFPKNISDENVVIDGYGVIADKYYTGNAIQQDTVEIAIMNDGFIQILSPETDYDISYENNTSVGEASLIINGKENYTGTVTKKFNIKYYDGIVTPAYNGNTTKDDWYTGDVTLTAAGFTISDSLSGTYASNYILTGEGTVSKILYFKQDGTGYITDGKTVTVNIDKTLPVFSGETDGITIRDNHWKSLLNTITFGHFFNETKAVSISATDSGSGVAKYYYYIDTTGSTTAKTAEELNALTFTEAVGGSFSISDDNKYVIYAYVVDFAGNKSAYICTDGIVIDKTAPIVTLTGPVGSDIGDISATANVQMNETGTITYVVKTSEQSSITAGDILDAAEKKTVSITDGQVDTDLDVALSGLTANTTYYIYAVGTDSAVNNSNVASTSFTTIKTLPVFTGNPTITGTYGQQVKDMTVSQVASTNGIVGSWSIADSATAVPSVGVSAAYDVVFTPDDAVHYATVTVQVTPTVNPKSLAADGVTIGAVSGTYTYDGTAKVPTVTVTDSTATMTVSDYEYSYSNNTNAGMATVTVMGKGNYAGTVNRTFTIDKAPAPSITYPTASDITYGQKLSASTLTDGSTQYGTFAWTDSNTVPTVANSGYEVNFTPNANTLANYEAITGITDTVDITISKATPAVTVNAAISDDAGSRKATLTVVVTGAGDGETPDGTVKFINSTSGSDVDIAGATAITITGGKATYTWTGLANQIYKVKAVCSGSGNYNTAASEELSFDTNKKNQAALAIENNGTKTYGDGTFTLSATGGSGSGGVTFTSSDSTIVSISGTTATIHKAGTVTLTATKAATDAYNEATASVALIVGKAVLTVKADNKLNIIKGAAMPALTYTVTGLVGSDTYTGPTQSTTSTDTNTVGEYDINISGGTLANADNYIVSYTGGKLTIINEPAPQGGSSTGGGSSTTTTTDTAQSDAGTPEIKDGNKAGWEAIKEQIRQGKEGDAETIEMNGSLVVPGEVLGTIRGTDTTLVFDMGDGIAWSVNGQSITDNNLEDINFGVTMDTDAIPENLINQVAKEQVYRSISLSHDGKFGFTAVLSIDMEKNAGLYANLFYYNPSSKKLELQSIGKINESGYVEFMFTHASDYVVTISTEPMFAKALDQIAISATKGNLYVGGTQNKSMTLKLEIPDLLKEAIENDSSKMAITYQSSNPNVATVTNTGKIIAKKSGKTTITTLVTINGVQKSFKTDIKVSKAYIKLIKSTKTLKKGKTFTFQVKGYGVNAKDITFYTSKKSIVEINKITGKAVAKSNGTDYVIAKAGNVEVKIKVKVE